MNSIPERLAALGVGIPEILLPRPGIDLEKWAVIACDQFTQDRAYWEKVKAFAGTSPSTLNLVFPELYLEDPAGRDARIQEIRRSMRTYLEEGVFSPPKRCMVYIERSTPRRPLRQGLVLALDLERYDWSPDARLPARATEGTIKERLPPRMNIRRGALLETPHILLLMDDEECAILPGLAKKAKTPLYDTPLMMNSGSVKGWALEGDDPWALLAEGLERLAGNAPSRYGTEDAHPFLFAAGDGNHSLAAAKGIWEEYKQAHKGEKNLENHPARWALVELENLYDPGISFEPIHRVLFGASRDAVLEALSALPDFSVRSVNADAGGPGGKAELVRAVQETGTKGNRLGFIAPCKDGLSLSLIETSASGIATASLQPLLDDFVRTHTGASIDYIHGEEELFRLAASPDRPALGLLLPPVQKKSLFRTTAQTGPLPRKSFSMGSAEEKRFYLECRKLFG
ncbi:MAG: DUF1015 domain-containing protein [Treponema sp.]|nr:DUF1015 domain-containing protein [Treponema sp.]